MPRDAYWDNLRQIAIDLRAEAPGKAKNPGKGFWKSFVGEDGLGALVGWLHYCGRCGYCAQELVREGQLIGGAVPTDHLLPRAKVPKLGFKSPFNAVPTCASCNSIKGEWDRSSEVSDFMGELDEDMHNRLVKLVKEFIKLKRGEADTRFKSEQDSWLTALKRARQKMRNRCCLIHG